MGRVASAPARVLAREALLILRQQAEDRALHVDAHLDPATAWGDPGLVERLVTNLVHNAIRHNVPSGHVEVSTTTSDGHATLRVTNTGPDIAEHDVPRLTQPFQRQAPNRTAARDGHGLGLAIVHAIATTHNARLTIRPRPGGGLDVEVVFPAHLVSTFDR
jgi:signal transduction histidine kinase